VTPTPIRSSVRWFGTPLGTRTADACTTVHRRTETLGADQAWATMCEGTARERAAPPHGTDHLGGLMLGFARASREQLCGSA
jgi:hypothetical protein